MILEWFWTLQRLIVKTLEIPIMYLNVVCQFLKENISWNKLFFFPLTSQCEESKEEDKAVEAYERVLKMEPNHEKAKDAIYNLRGLAKDAEDLGIDIK